MVITDLAAPTWDRPDEAQDALVSEGPEVKLTLFDLGDFSQANLALSDLRIADATPPAGIPVPLTIDIELLGEPTNPNASVAAELQLYENDPSLPLIRDGAVQLPATRDVDRKSVRVAAGGAASALLTVPPLAEGTHHGRIRLVGDDPLPLDDVRYFTLRVLKPEPLLLVCEDDDEAAVLESALADEFTVEKIKPDDAPVVRFSDYRAALLIDPPRRLLEDEMLSEFVQQGGGVLVCLGPAIGEAAFEPLGMPTPKRRWRAPEPGTFFQFRSVSHPSLTQFAEIDGGVPWSDFRVFQYWQTEPAADDAILITYSGSDHPALTERRLPGDSVGRWLMLSTPLPALAVERRGWNDLFSGSEPWPAFLLVRYLAEYLAGRGDQQPTVSVGTPTVLDLNDGQSPQQDGGAERRFQLFAPAAKAAVPLSVAVNAKQAVYGDVSKAGTYWLRGLTTGTAGFSANLPAAATDLRRIEKAELDQRFGPEGYLLVRDREEIELAEHRSRQRVLLQAPIMLLALLAFLLEQLLSNRFYRGNASDRSAQAGSNRVAA